jgi:1-acyl-sn-glycerol-3-phosphate acyltransferase
VGDVPALPFRSGLIAQTIEAGAPMRAAFIHYTLSPRDIAAGKTLREYVHWGDQTLVEHIWKFVGLHGLRGTVRFATEPIAFSPAAIADRKVAAMEAQAAVVALSGESA